MIKISNMKKDKKESEQEWAFYRQTLEDWLAVRQQHVEPSSSRFFHFHDTGRKLTSVIVEDDRG